MPRDISNAELQKNIQKLEVQLNKSAAVKGAAVMTDLSNAPNTYFLRRPSGIMSLDLDTGGGLPAGGLTYLSGPDGTGKTFLLYMYMAMNQRLYGSKSAIALAVTEAAPDHFFMRKCGMQVEIPEQMIEERIAERKVRGMPPFTKEELQWFRQKTVGHFKILRGAHGEEICDAILNCFDTGLFDIIGLDSVSALLPKADAGKDLDENLKRAAAASLLTTFFQHYLNGTTGYTGGNPTTVLFTSQVRANAKKAEAMAHIQKFLPDYAAQGAWAAKHGKLIDILVKPGAKEKEKVVESAPGSMGGEKFVRREQVGKTVVYEIMKGKAGVHEGIAGEFDFQFHHHTDMLCPVDIQRSVILSGMKYGAILENNGAVTVYDPSSGQPYQNLTNIPSVDTLAGMMRAEFALELAVRRVVLTAAGVSCAYQ